MGVKISVDDRKFQEAILLLKQTSANSQDYEDALRSEAGSIMVTVASMAKPALVGTVKKQAFADGITITSEGRYTLTINNGKRRGQAGIVWLRNEEYNGAKKVRRAGISGGKAIKAGKLNDTQGAVRFSPTEWAIVQELYTRAMQTGTNRVTAAVQSIGLEQQSWLQIVQSLGFDPMTHAPKGKRRSIKSLTAKTRGGKMIRMGSSRTLGNSSKFFVETLNRSEIAYKAKKRKGDAGKSGIEKVEAAKRIRASAIRKRIQFELEAKNKAANK